MSAFPSIRRTRADYLAGLQPDNVTALFGWKESHTTGNSDFLVSKTYGDNETASWVCAVGVILPDRAYLKPRGNWSPNYSKPLHDAKLQFSLGSAGSISGPLGSDFDKTINIVKVLQHLGGTTGNHRFFLGEYRQRPTMRLSFPLFSARTVEYDPNDHTDPTLNYPIGEDLKDLLRSSATSHTINPLPFYDEAGVSLKRNFLDSQLMGAVVEVWFSFHHYAMGPQGKPPTSDTFVGRVEQLRVLRRPSGPASSGASVERPLRTAGMYRPPTGPGPSGSIAGNATCSSGVTPAPTATTSNPIATSVPTVLQPRADQPTAHQDLATGLAATSGPPATTTAGVPPPPTAMTPNPIATSAPNVVEQTAAQPPPLPCISTGMASSHPPENAMAPVATMPVVHQAASAGLLPNPTQVGSVDGVLYLSSTSVDGRSGPPLPHMASTPNPTPSTTVPSSPAGTNPAEGAPKTPPPSGHSNVNAMIYPTPPAVGLYGSVHGFQPPQSPNVGAPSMGMDPVLTPLTPLLDLNNPLTPQPSPSPGSSPNGPPISNGQTEEVMPTPDATVARSTGKRKASEVSDGMATRSKKDKIGST
ncbi:hypothetical protein MD484_g6898, partial [Candolleomyces efflorescens]